VTKIITFCVNVRILYLTSQLYHHFGSNYLFLLWDATDNAALHHEEGIMTAEVKSMNTSAVGIAPGITNRPHVAMTGVKKNMTQNAANEVETEVRGAVVMTRTDVKRAKSAVQCISSMSFHLPTL
jgi:hypothetical protein